MRSEADSRTIKNLNHLYKTKRSDFVNFALGFLHNKEESEDAVSEAFRKATSKAHQYSGNTQQELSNWVFEIIKNTCLNNKNRRVMVSTDDPDFELKNIQNIPHTKPQLPALKILIKELKRQGLGEIEIQLAIDKYLDYKAPERETRNNINKYHRLIKEKKIINKLNNALDTIHKKCPGFELEFENLEEWN